MAGNICAMCGKPILGYWFEVGKNKNVCQSCSIASVYDLYIKGIISVFPKTIEVEDAVIVDDKSTLNAEYGMAVEKIADDNEGVVYEVPYDTVVDTSYANLSD